jgi:RHS repeat-associated protein
MTRFALLWCAVLASFLHSDVGSAQTFRELIAPDRPVVDSRGVDVALGEINVTTDPVSIGDLATASSWSGVTNFNKFYAYIGANGTNRYVFLHGKSFKFLLSGGSYVPANADGSTLVKSPSGLETWTYTSPEGSVYYFVRRVAVYQPDWLTIRAHLLTVTNPDGRKLTYNYKDVYGTQVCGHQCYTPTKIRVQSITSSDGLMLKASFASNTFSNDFNRLTSVQAINLSQDYCDPNADSCGSLTQTWPSQTIAESTSGSTTTRTITDQDGVSTAVDTVAQKVVEVTPPADTSGAVDVVYDGSGKVDAVTGDGVTYDYSYSTSGSTQTTTVTGPGSATETFVVDTSISRPTSITTATGQTTTFQYDGSARRTRETYPEGNYTQWTYDSRGNITEIRHVAKPGSGLADIVETASYDASCVNVKKCNKPNYTIDARGKRTDYTYDATHGGVTRVQLPAPDGSTPRPEINYSYTQFSGQVRNSAGVLVSTGDPQYKVTQITTCATAATCAGSATETKVTMAYNTPNLKMTSLTTASGDGALSATIGYTYNLMGDVATIDGPLPGADDTTYYFYTLNHRLRGIIGPDPDGAGPRLRPAMRNTYLGFKPVQKTETGTVTGTDLAALNAITPVQTIDYTYDAFGKKTKEVVSGTAGAVNVVQYSYDGERRLLCTALRLNPATWGALPGACTAATSGSDGPDRITRNSYDASNRITKVETALGTAAAADEVRTAYTVNGLVDHVIDAESNRTTYIYDGHDRLSQTRYPSTTKGANSSNASDYEQLGYDAGGNVTSRRLRDGTTINYSYDDLGRVTAKDLPGSEPDTSYSYDLLGRALSVAQGGHSLGFVHNALGQVTSQTGPLGTIGYTYDAAGRRLTMSYPGGTLTINYDYDVAGNVTAVRENGATSGVGVLAAYAYDSVGRRSSVTYGNGSVQSFGYDAASRLSTLTNNLNGSGTAHDLTQTFNYNPAGQIASVTRSNDAYAWQAHYNVDRSYAMDGLNRIMNVGSTAFAYDGRGNLTSDGTNSFTYTSENLLKSGPGGATLGYDPLGRLYETAKSGVTTRFLYDGIDMIGEYNGSSAIERRYVHGPGIDNPIVWYEGSTIDNSSRRFLMADERGSVVSITDSANATIHINAYDEYGIPAPGNIGRFGYTGQTWLPEVGMWYYKARIYSPTLGRFMQTDPIGYSDGMNWYNYVGSDPVNFVDPLGLSCQQFPGGYFMFRDSNGNGKWDEGEDVVEIGVCGSASTGGSVGGMGRPRGSGGRGSTGPTPQNNGCAVGSKPSTARQIAEGASEVGQFADGVTVAAGIFGLATAPTGAGPAGAAIVGGISAVVSRGAAVVSTVAYAVDGDWANATGSLVGIVGGSFAGAGARGLASRNMAKKRAFGNLSASQKREASLVGEATAGAYGKTVGLMGCP